MGYPPALTGPRCSTGCCVLAAGRQYSLPHSLLHSAGAARQHTRSAVLGAELVQGAGDRLDVEGVEQEEAADVAAVGVPQLGAAPALARGDHLGAFDGDTSVVPRRHAARPRAAPAACTHIQSITAHPRQGHLSRRCASA